MISLLRVSIYYLSIDLPIYPMSSGTVELIYLVFELSTQQSCLVKFVNEVVGHPELSQPVFAIMRHQSIMFASARWVPQ